MNGLTVRPAITALNRKRNWSLKEAKKRLLNSDLRQGQEVTVNMKERHVKVGDGIAFFQEKNDPIGQFATAFSSLAFS